MITNNDHTHSKLIIPFYSSFPFSRPMADLLHFHINPLLLQPPSSSLPLPLSRFSPLRRRFSHSSKLSPLSISNKLFIISTTELSDGSFAFKFGDESEVSKISDDVEELETETVSDSYDSSVKAGNSIEISPLSEEIEEVSDVQDSVETEQNHDLVSAEQVGDSSTSDSDLTKHEISEIDGVVVAADHLSADETVVEMSDDDSEVETGDNDSNVENLKLTLTAEGGEVGETGEEEVEDGVEEMGELVELPVQLKAESILDEEIDSDLADGVVEMGSSLGGDEVYVASSPTADYPITNDTLEKAGPEISQMILVEANPDGENSVSDVKIPTAELSMSPAAVPSSLSAKVDDPSHPSSVKLEDDLNSINNSDAAVPGTEASKITSAEATCDSSLNGDISTPTMDMSSAPESIPEPTEVNDAATAPLLRSDDDLYINAISEPGGFGPESSGIASAETNFDREQISTVSLPMPCDGESLPHLLEVTDAAPEMLQSEGDLCSDVSVAANLGPTTSEILAETNLESRNESVISAPSLSLESAAASLTHSAEALAGGEDAYFICDNWFGVADGVGQWTLKGINRGLYAKEFMQNCKMLAQERQNAGLTNVKEFLQHCAAMTESTGAARVLVAHLANQALHVANIGDSGFVVIRKGFVVAKSSPMFHEFNFPYAVGSGEDTVEAVEEYHVGLEDGDIIVTATDGLFDNLYEQEIASIVVKAIEEEINVKDLAELLSRIAQEVGGSASIRTPFADAAQAAGHAGISGGKFDHVTVIVSQVHLQSG